MSALDEVIERLHAEIADLKETVRANQHAADREYKRRKAAEEEIERLGSELALTQAELARRTAWWDDKVSTLAAALEQAEAQITQLNGRTFTTVQGETFSHCTMPERAVLDAAYAIPDAALHAPITHAEKLYPLCDAIQRWRRG